jgi:imidazoleglycerol phosphate synthase glutamine amidotransferase subunit HisH
MPWQIGWNGIKVVKPSVLLEEYSGQPVYFVHSYYAQPTDANKEWILSTTDYSTGAQPQLTVAQLATGSRSKPTAAKTHAR